MKILPCQFDTTNDLLTSGAGLLSVAELMNSLGLADRIDACFSQPGSNRGFKPAVFMETLILMQHEGGFHLDQKIMLIIECGAINSNITNEFISKSPERISMSGFGNYRDAKANTLR